MVSLRKKSSMSSALYMFCLLAILSCTSFGEASISNSFPSKDMFNNDIMVHYEAIGCYRDRYADRALRILYYNLREGNIDWSRWPNVMEDVVRTCAQKAYEKGFKRLFGVQFYGECWSDGDAEKRFKKHGDSNNCVYGVGQALTNQIYRFTEKVSKSPLQCNVNGKVYNVNDVMTIPNDWSADPNEAKCMKCKCSADGSPIDCLEFYHCHLGRGSLCSRYKNTTAECCPVCDCYHDGKVMPINSRWAVKINNYCSECTCGSNRIASCTGRQFICLPCDGQVIPQSDQCCPKCVPKGTTTPAPQTLPPQTQPPTLPPFPGPL